MNVIKNAKLFFFLVLFLLTAVASIHGEDVAANKTAETTTGSPVVSSRDASNTTNSTSSSSKGMSGFYGKFKSFLGF